MKRLFRRRGDGEEGTPRTRRMKPKGRSDRVSFDLRVFYGRLQERANILTYRQTFHAFGIGSFHTLCCVNGHNGAQYYCCICTGGGGGTFEPRAGRPGGLLSVVRLSRMLLLIALISRV